MRREACLIVTASEDNTAKLYSALTPSLSSSSLSAPAHTLPSGLASRSSSSCVATLVDHPDVVRAIVLSPESSSLSDSIDATSTLTCLIFTGGGRDFLHCSRVRATSTSASTPISVVVESLASVGGSLFPTAGKLVSTSKAELVNERMIKQDMRIMCLTAVPIPTQCLGSASSAGVSSSSSPAPSSLHLVVSGNSVGVLKFFLFDSSRASSRLLAECPHHKYNVLSLCHIVIGGDVLIFSGATDGWIRVWSVEALKDCSSFKSTREQDAASSIASSCASRFS